MVSAEPRRGRSCRMSCPTLGFIRPLGFRIRMPFTEERTATFELREVKLGGDDEADLCIVHESVSPEFRARIRQQDGELIITNYASARAPMKVNGAGANVCSVVHGDVIRVGEVDIEVVFEVKIDPREQALIDDIVKSPDDELSRSVYADWLEENGFADRAQYLRFDAEIAQTLKGKWPLKIREDVALHSGLAKNLPPRWLELMKRRAMPDVRLHESAKLPKK